MNSNTSTKAPGLPRPTELVRMLLERCVREKEVVVDATAGNGHDTVFLAKLVGNEGRVLAFDIQEAAIEASRERVKANECEEWVQFFQESHVHLASRVGLNSVAAVVFNLGYLPGSDQTVITHTEETLVALTTAQSVLKPGGCLVVVCYPGHVGGDEESTQVVRWFESRSQELQSARYELIGTLRPAPFVLIGVKR